MSGNQVTTYARKRYIAYVVLVIVASIIITVLSFKYVGSIYDAILVFGLSMSFGVIAVEFIDKEVTSAKDTKGLLLIFAGGVIALSIVGTLMSLVYHIEVIDKAGILIDIAKLVLQSVVSTGFIVLGASLLKGSKWEATVISDTPIKKVEIEKT